MKFKLSSVSRYLRPVVQLTCLAATVALFLNIGQSTLTVLANNVTLADPIMTVASVLFYRGAWFPVLISVSVLIFGSYLLGRAFCGWICPVGFLIDLSGIVSKFVSRLLRRRRDTYRYGFLQYGLLAAVILLSLVTMDALSILDPFVILRRTLYMIASGSLPDVLLLILLASIVIAPRFWCRAICPAGAIIGLASLVSPFKLNLNCECKNCKKCTRVCSMGAISKDLKWDATACIRCLECESKCPNGSVSFAMPKKDHLLVSRSRRALLVAGGMVGLFALTKGTASALADAAGRSGGARAAAGERPLLRPPGSLEEEKFNAACLRCESCARVCPAGVIEPVGLDRGLEKIYTPVLNYGKSKCYLCGKCGDVCPNGTIAKVPQEQMKIGTAQIDKNTCYAWNPKPGSTQTCLLCKSACKHGAITSEGNYNPAVAVAKCVGCGGCELKCPVKGKAITVANSGEIRREI